MIAHVNKRVLIVEDDPPVGEYFQCTLEKEGYETDIVTTVSSLQNKIKQQHYDLILLDNHLPDGKGINLARQIKSDQPHIKIIMITGLASMDVAIEAMRNGINDFIPKPVSPEELLSCIENCFPEENPLSPTNKIAPAKLIGESEAIIKIKQTIDRVAESDCSILIYGETGTGKEMIARAIHEKSARAQGEMVALNCSAIPKELLESELFGHEKGSFSGAVERRIGCVELAHKSSLFLDEIGEMEISSQPKLLRFLEEHMFHRVGGNETIHSDLRLISATNKNPEQLVADKLLREDLFYRLNVVRIEVPPLRKREEDITLLAYYYMERSAALNNKQFNHISDEAMACLSSYSWPGNVRQLQHSIAGIVVMNQGKEITLNMLPERIKQLDDTSPFQESPIIGTSKDVRPLVDVEKEVIQHALGACKGNVSRAAEKLLVSRATMYRKIKEFDLEYK